MEDYIRDHFDRFLSEQERANIMVSLPRPQSDFLASPQLDEEVRKFLAYDLKDKFLNNPLEPKLFSVQNLLLEVSGPLLCLWSNLLDETRTISRPEIIQIILVSMVLLVNASNSITVERRKAILSKINGKYIRLADERFEDRGTQLFGPTLKTKIDSMMHSSETLSKASKSDTVRSSQIARPFRGNNRYFRTPDPQRYGSRGQQSASYPQTAQNQKHNHKSPALPIPFKLQKTLTSQSPLITCLSQLPNSLPAGRLRFALANWALITSNTWILEVISGLKLPFLTQPDPLFFPGLKAHHFNSIQDSAISLEINQLLTKGAISVVQAGKSSFMSPIFIVPKKDRKWRLILDLSVINTYLLPVHFKMESIKSLTTILQPEHYMVRLDLKDAYLSIPFSQSYQRFLAFKWKEKVYAYQGMPFGLSIAPRVFTKVMRVPITRLRELGLHMLVYLDDILLVSDSYTTLQSYLEATIYLLEALGLQINREKSHLVPTQSLTFLGFVINTTPTCLLSLTVERVTRVKKLASDILRRKYFPIRTLATFLGLLESTRKVIPSAPLRMRLLQVEYRQALRRNSRKYNSLMSLSAQARQAVISWRQMISTQIQQPIHLPTDLI